MLSNVTRPPHSDANLAKTPLFTAACAPFCHKSAVIILEWYHYAACLQVGITEILCKFALE